VREETGALEELTAWRASSEGPGLLSPAQLEALRHRLDGTAAVELVDLVRTRLPELAGSHARSVLLVPLRAGGHEVGVIAGTSRFALALDRGQAESVGLLAGHAAASIDAAVAISHARKSATTDVLTGLLNRRGVEEYLERELVSAERAGAAVSLLAIDCDDFKDLNDRAGHAFGDAVLRELARVLVDALPATAVSGRFGGDEFVVVMREVPSERTVAICDEIVASLVAGLDRSGFPLRVSGGVATFPRDAPTATTLMRAADQALYEAKAVGKNCVIGFSDIGRARDRVDVNAPRTGGRSFRGEYATAQRLGEAVSAIWEETTWDGVLQRLSRSLTFLIGAAACVVSRIDGDRLVDVVRHALSDVDLGEETSRPVAAFPLLQQVLPRGGAQAATLLDPDLDDAEAARLRGLRMSCCLLAPLRVGDRTWGLVRTYERRLRRFGEDEIEVAEFLVDRAGRRLEILGPEPGMFGPLRTT
jgi:diguanylate cyclase (GGDEF)-like protein